MTNIQEIVQIENDLINCNNNENERNIEIHRTQFNNWLNDNMNSKNKNSNLLNKEDVDHRSIK